MPTVSNLAKSVLRYPLTLAVVALVAGNLLGVLTHL